MRTIQLVAVAMAAVGGMAGAQTVEFSNGVYALQGCYQASGGVRCDMTFTPSTNYSGVIQRDWFEVVTADGANIEASQVAAAGGNLTGNSTTQGITFFKGAPVKLSIIFPASASTTSFRVLGVAGQGINNVSVRGTAAAPRPAGAAAPVNTGNYSAVLTNCRAGANGTLTCTATLTPRR